MPVYGLTINEQPFIAAGGKTAPAADLVSLRCSYNSPRELVLAVDDPARVGLNARVVLTVDGVVRFRGTTISYTPDEQLARRHSFTALDLSERADAVQILKWKWTLGLGALWTMFYAKQSVELATLLDEIAAAAGEELEGLGVVAAGSVFSGSRAGSVRAMELHPDSFRGLLDRVLAAVSGAKWLYVPAASADGTGGTFRIVNVLALGQHLQLTVTDVESLPLTRSIEGRYSRVRIEPTVYTTAGEGQAALLPAWNAGLEASWTPDLAGQALNQNPYSDVYRRWSFAHLPHTVIADMPVELFQQVQTHPLDDVGHPVSVEIERIDVENRLLWSRNPLIKYYSRRNVPINPWLRAHPRGPLAVGLRYWYSDQAIMTAVEVGPEGSAYTRYGIDRLLRVSVDSVQDVTPAKAREILDLVKDEAVSGSVPLIGPMPAGLWDLGCTVSVSAPGKATGLEGVRAIVSGYTHEFGGGGRTTVEVNSDRSAFATVVGATA
ncbi:MAG TPA: hypothetical protein PLL65_20960 [Phycisphaerae bacterium]|nr:hypothetical protein [Phycisphaerae bacterium]HOM53804.1 hypothetical protein [Phycisphaerae bacterium]HON68604.1 hypothetical protein [Phycisphaerae bacterium]